MDLLKPRKAQPLLPGIGKTTVCYQPKGVVGVISQRLGTRFAGTGAPGLRRLLAAEMDG